MDTAATSGGYVKNGLIKAYAITGKTRSSALPEVPTVDEAGMPGLHVALWHAMWAPKGTPDAIVRALNGAITKTLTDLATRQRLTDISQELFPQDRLTPEALAAFHAAEIETWWPIIKASGSKAE